MLTINNIVAGYEGREVISGVSIEVKKGEIVSLIGHNGAGKSSLLKCVFGLIPIWRGEVIIDEAPFTPSPQSCLAAGVVYVPQGNRVFTALTVRENLEMGGYMISDQQHRRLRIKDMCNLFPALGTLLKQPGAVLSGGERQMLAIASALMSSPRLLLADEPSLGLSPNLIKAALNTLRDLSRDAGVAILLVEQKVRAAIDISDRVYVLRQGKIAFCGESESLRDDSTLKRYYL